MLTEQMCYRFWMQSGVCGWEKRDAETAGERSSSQTKNFI